MSNAHYESELFKKLSKNLSFQRIKEVFGSFFKNPIWCLNDDRGFLSPHFKVCESKKKCRFYNLLSDREKNSCYRNLIAIFQKSQKTKHINQFKCKNKTFGLVLPLVQGDKIYGYLGVCNIEREIPKELISMLEVSIETVLKEAQKELELSKLYETIRPRAVALSTVHTIYRLMSSTLNLEELLPRVARLFLQVLRARRCFISLIDDESKNVSMKVAIDLKKKRPSRKESLKARFLEKSVIKNGRSIFKRKYLSIPLIDEDTIGVISVFEKSEKGFDSFDQEIMSRLAEQAVIAIKNAKLYKEQENITLASIKSIAMLLEARAPKAYKKSPTFIKIMLAMGEEMKMGEDDIRGLYYAALLHDASQAALPDEILKKGTKLTGKEYRIIKSHPLKSAKIMQPLKLLKPAMPVILFHHENYDGSGYPKGLKGEEIPLGARIMAVASAFLAMIAKRPYKAQMKVRDSIEEIKRCSSVQFDPAVVEVFLKVMERRDIIMFLKKEGYEIE